MARKGKSTEEIIAALREAGGGISEQTSQEWRREYGVSQTAKPTIGARLNRTCTLPLPSNEAAIAQNFGMTAGTHRCRSKRLIRLLTEPHETRPVLSDRLLGSNRLPGGNLTLET